MKVILLESGSLYDDEIYGVFTSLENVENFIINEVKRLQESPLNSVSKVEKVEDIQHKLTQTSEFPRAGSAEITYLATYKGRAVSAHTSQRKENIPYLWREVETDQPL